MGSSRDRGSRPARLPDADDRLRDRGRLPPPRGRVLGHRRRRERRSRSSGTSGLPRSDRRSWSSWSPREARRIDPGTAGSSRIRRSSGSLDRRSAGRSGIHGRDGLDRRARAPGTGRAQVSAGLPSSSARRRDAYGDARRGLRLRRVGAHRPRRRRRAFSYDALVLAFVFGLGLGVLLAVGVLLATVWASGQAWKLVPLGPWPSPSG